MIREQEVSLFDLFMSLSNAIDLIDSRLNNHHKMVAYIAYNIGKEYGLPEEKLYNLLIAGIVHDIGELKKIEQTNNETKIETKTKTRVNDIYEHAKILVKNNLPDIAKIVLHHHIDWGNVGEKQINNKGILIESDILHFADKIAEQISKDEYILSQRRKIENKMIEKLKKNSSLTFANLNNKDLIENNIAEAFLKCSIAPGFWFDLVSNNLHSNLLEIEKGLKCATKLNKKELLEKTNLFAYVIDSKSPYTANHTKGVVAISKKIAELYGLTEEQIINVQIAANLHDLGKLIIPNSILDKPGSLTDEEFEKIQQHPHVTHDLLINIKGMEEVVKAASYHHQGINGQGYPFDLKPNELTEEARLIAIADIITATMEDRPYRKGMTKEQVIGILQDSVTKGKIDKQIVDIAVKNFDEIDKARIEAQQVKLKVEEIKPQAKETINIKPEVHKKGAKNTNLLNTKTTLSSNAEFNGIMTLLKRNTKNEKLDLGVELNI